MSKKRIKKFLKKVAPIALAGFGAAMLGKRRRQAREMKDFLETEGGDISNMMSRPNMMDIAGSVIKPRKKPIRMTSANVQRGLIDAPFANARIPGQSVMASPDLNTGAFDLGFKKGGRVGCGVAKKGFGKAMKKRRK